MSMSASLASISTAAVVLETLTNVKGVKSVKVEYIDAMARPDLAGKKSTFLDLCDQEGAMPAVGSVVTVNFAPKKDKRFPTTFWVGTVVA